MKPNTHLHLLFFSFFIFLFIGCKKKDLETQTTNAANLNSITSQKTLSGPSGSSCIDDVDDGSGYDSILKPTILGYHLVNHPYSLTVMQQAYASLFGNANGVALTHKYVRFKPSSIPQLSVLEDLDIDLSDYPLDYDVVQDGDYYNDGITPAEEIPWLYAVVDINFIPPSGITYEVLEQIHVPELAVIENEAFVLTGNPVDDPSCNEGASLENFDPPCDAQVCPPDQIFDASICACVPDCPPGSHWDGMQCVVDGPPPPNPVRQPSGTITVTDNTLQTLRPVRNARIVAKRFLKIERTYTNNQGQFFLYKEFNRVHIKLKFINDQAKIRALRRARLWQILFPVARNLGRFRGNLNNIAHNIPYNADARTDGARDWAAGTAHNNVQEFRDFAIQQQIGLPPNKLRILLTNWGLQGTSGSAPMYAKRFWQTLPTDFVTTFIISNFSGIAGGLTGLVMVLKSEVDITTGYNSGNEQTAFSDDITETMLHEQTHAAHYNVVGNNWWADFVNAEVAEIFAGPRPYGNGTTTNSPIIALGESWAYHMGHFMTDLKYGINSTPVREQDITYSNSEIREMGIIVANTGLNAHINLLEDFSPLRTNDPFRWIPQGLYYDLMDNRNDNNAIPTRVPLNDNVINYTNQQFFNAFDQDITTLPNYRVRLLSENANNQSAGVTTIFNFYGY